MWPVNDQPQLRPDRWYFSSIPNFLAFCEGNYKLSCLGLAMPGRQS
jgi:hypothetical protein